LADSIVARNCRSTRRADLEAQTRLRITDSAVALHERLGPARLADFYAYLRAVEDGLMSGRGLRGRAARRTRAALGHALTFPTWRSLTRERGLGDSEAVALMSVLVEGAAAGR